MFMDRSAINRALAKAIAYKQCGKDREAEVWASILIEHLELTGILRPDNELERLRNNARCQLA